MKAVVKFKQEKLEVVDVVDAIAIPYGGSSRAICPKKYEYHKLKILVLKQKVNPDVYTKKKK